MSGKKLLFDPKLRQTLIAGSAAVCGTVSSNFGPLGGNTICEQRLDLPLAANTGRRILENMTLPDAGKNLSAVLIRDAALNVASKYGDGSISTALLTDALLQSGGKLVAAGYSPCALRRGFARAAELLPELLSEVTASFSSVPSERFARSVSKNDEVAENSVKAFAWVGADGIITVSDTQSRSTTVHLWDGARYDYGLYSSSFMTDTVHRCAVLEHPYVLLSNVKIESMDDIRRILTDALSNGSPLLIIARDMSEEVQNALIANRERAGVMVVAAKAPGFGNSRRRNMLALAAKTGSLLFDENTGYQLRDCGLSVCARVRRAEIDGEASLLQGFEHSSEEMTGMLLRHTQSLYEKTADAAEREKLQITLSILCGKTAEICVGAVSEYEMFEKKYLYENTVRALQNAARSGVVPGAGSVFLFLARKLPMVCGCFSEEEQLGVQCLCKALRSLTARLAENVGDDAGTVLSRLDAAPDPWQGYDAAQHKLTDLRGAGIVMPRAAAEAVVRTAVETAGVLLTASAAVLE